MADQNPTLYIIDGSAYIYRAFYAVRHLSNSKGMPTNALYGFLNMLKKLIDKEDPDYLAMIFDRYDEEDEKRSFRHEMYGEYKANRSQMPDDMRVQVPYFARIVEAMNIPVLAQSGVEADDVIATMTKQAVANDLEVCIVSADKDLLQLLTDERVRMIDTMRDKTYNRQDVIERFGVPPEQVRHVMALAGDSSDNVPGVPGIGEKTGGQLIQEYGDLETLLANTDKITAKKRRQNLEEYADQARMSLALVTLKDDCEIVFDMGALKISAPNVTAFDEVLGELEFYSSMKSFRLWFQKRGWISSASAGITPSAPTHKHGQQSLFAPPVVETTSQGLIESIEPRRGKTYTTIFTEEALDEVIEALKKAPRWAFDLETTSVEALNAQIIGLSFAWKPNEAVYIPVGHEGEDVAEQLPLELVLGAIRPLLEDPAPKKVGQHVKYERMCLDKYGINYRGILFDTMLMSYLLDPGKASHSLDSLAMEFLGYKTITYEEVAGKGKKQIPFAQVSIEVATQYGAEDSDVTLLLAEKMEVLLSEQLRTLHDTLELPLSDTLAKMELTGICIDSGILGQMSEEFDQDLVEVQAKIDAYALEEGGTLNPNSPKQLREVLFDTLELPVKKRTASGPSTDQSVLEQLATLHPLPNLILEYRQIAKLKNTYVDALPKLVRKDTGRVHTDFNQAVTATGRLSSSNPNLQNIPIRTAQGKRIRRTFIPQPGWTLLCADYSQIELRLTAHMSGDETMLQAYREGQDIHALTASKIFDVPLEEVTRAQRGVGKTINFGVLYGMGSHRLARELDITMTQAKEYIDNYFARFHGIATFFETLKHEGQSKGVVHTLFGRRRLIPPEWNTGARRAFADRVAMNTPIQGTAADIIKMAMLAIQKEISTRSLPMQMLLQVHDELVFEVAPAVAEEARVMVMETMEGIVSLDVPLKVDAKLGANWLEAH